MTLSGGTFGQLKVSSTNDVPLTEWLATGCAFWQGENRLERGYVNKSSTISNVRVAPCGTHNFYRGVCSYCGYDCEHSTVTGDGSHTYCTICKKQLFARITAGEAVTYYDSVIVAFNALDGITEPSVTLAILGTPTANKQLKVSKTVTLDLSGGSIIKESEGNGSYSLEACDGANLTITGSGAVKCATGSIEGNGILVSGGNLNVQGGEFGVAGSGRYGLVVNGGTVQLTGGTFHGISALSEATGGLPALLAPGYAYFTTQRARTLSRA